MWQYQFLHLIFPSTSAFVAKHWPSFITKSVAVRINGCAQTTGSKYSCACVCLCALCICVDLTDLERRRFGKQQINVAANSLYGYKETTSDLQSVMYWYSLLNAVKCAHVYICTGLSSFQWWILWFGICLCVPFAGNERIHINRAKWTIREIYKFYRQVCASR